MSQRLVFVGLDTDTVDCGGQGVVLNLDEMDYEPSGDDYFDESEITTMAQQHGVTIEELWQAYTWKQGLVQDGLMATVERFVENLYTNEVTA